MGKIRNEYILRKKNNEDYVIIDETSILVDEKADNIIENSATDIFDKSIVSIK